MIAILGVTLRSNRSIRLFPGPCYKKSRFALVRYRIGKSFLRRNESTALSREGKEGGEEEERERERGISNGKSCIEVYKREMEGEEAIFDTSSSLTRAAGGKYDELEASPQSVRVPGP